jgi:hypothetical protein
MAASLAGKTRLRPHQEKPQGDRSLRVILKDREDEWKAIPNPYATACSNVFGFSILKNEMETSTPPTIQGLAVCGKTRFIHKTLLKSR